MRPPGAMYAGLFAVALIFLPILIHGFIVVGIFVLRDMIFEALRKLCSRTVLVTENAELSTYGSIENESI